MALGIKKVDSGEVITKYRGGTLHKLSSGLEYLVVDPTVDVSHLMTPNLLLLVTSSVSSLRAEDIAGIPGVPAPASKPAIVTGDGGNAGERLPSPAARPDVVLQ